MIEEQLVNYGILGIWTASLLWERYNFQRRMGTIIENNTIALNNFQNKFLVKGGKNE